MTDINNKIDGEVNKISSVIKKKVDEEVLGANSEFSKIKSDVISDTLQIKKDIDEIGNELKKDYEDLTKAIKSLFTLKDIR